MNGFDIRPIGGPRAGSPGKGSGGGKRRARERAAEAVTRSAGAALGGWSWLRTQKRILGWRRLLLRIAGVGFLAGLLYLALLWFTLPNLEDPRNLFAAQSTVIVDRNGVELYRLHGEEDRTVVPGDRIATSVKDAVVAIEDARFYDRGCIDLRAVARAGLLLGRRGGASTLTRQLARNALNLKRENIVSRKLKELILGCQLESQYSKAELLDLYLNWIPFGQNAYGIEQASRRFFGISASELTLAQSAVLASLPQLPTYFSPYGKHVRTTVSEEVTRKIVEGEIAAASQIADREVRIGLLGTLAGSGSATVYVGGRADQVLHNMREQGYITEDKHAKAVEELRTIAFKPARESIRAPYFVLWVREQIEQMYEETADSGLLEQGGLTVETTLDWRLQQAAEKAVAGHRADVLKRFGAHNVALVSLDPKTREVLAYVGNADYADQEHGGKVDMALAPRQPGSSFKPFVYAAAFLRGYGPATPLYDVRTKFGPDEPENYDGTFWGLTNARRALGGSRNIPAIKTFFLAGGEESILALAAKMGAPSPLTERERLRKKVAPAPYDYGWPLALGAAETPLIEMVEGFSTFADGGMYKPVVSIRRITRDGVLLPMPLDSDPEEAGEQVLDPRIAYQVTSILSDVAARPGEYWQNMLSVPGYQAATKTGTSNKPCPPDEKKNEKEKGTCKIRPGNVWTIGYTPHLAAGVWVGNADHAPLSPSADGLTVAAPIWKDYMTAAHKALQAPASPFPVPSGLVQPIVSTLSGQLPTECTPVSFRRPDVFLQERAPTLADPACVRVEVDRVTGLLASELCPAEAREMRGFLVLKSELPERFPEWEHAERAWLEGQRGGTGALAGFTISPPPTEVCDPSKTPGRLEKPTVELESPSDGGSATYPLFQPTLRFTAGSAVREVAFAIDGRTIAKESAPIEPDVTKPPPPGANNWLNRLTIRVPRSIAKEGSHALEVTLTDAFYNTATDSVSFSFGNDVAGPRVRLLVPENGAVVKSGTELVIRVSASDQSGLKFVEFYLDSLLLARDPAEPFELEFPLTTVTPGMHTVRAVATDLGGQTEEDMVEVFVEL